jgi:hypothetical protein
MRPRQYILDGHTPVPCENIFIWAKQFEETDQRRVAWTDVRPGVEVSTVFLGIDHNFFGEGPPILFETMVFRDGAGCEDERYATWDEAEQGHARMVAQVERETP